jgi:hypothetical protein
LGISKAHHGSALFLQVPEVDNGLIHEVNTETTQTVRASEDGAHLKDNLYEAIRISEENVSLREESKDQAILPPLDTTEILDTPGNLTPIEHTQRDLLDQDFGKMMKMNESKSMAEMTPAADVQTPELDEQ